MGKTLDQEETSKRIKTLCSGNEVTVDMITQVINVSRQTVYAWFSGKKVPTVDHLIELADILELPVDDLIVTKEYIY